MSVWFASVLCGVRRVMSFPVLFLEAIKAGFRRLFDGKSGQASKTLSSKEQDGCEVVVRAQQKGEVHIGVRLTHLPKDKRPRGQRKVRRQKPTLSEPLPSTLALPQLPPPSPPPPRTG